ncbi:MAG: VIT1/CCC1 family protein [Chloroflexi bacterium]|nr:VIT1/CCC1 family protein [Chloroflexota bacterium]
MSSTNQDIERFKQNLQKEVDGAALYLVLASKEARPEMKTVYERLAESEQRHAQFWREKLAEAGVKNLKEGTTWRTQTLIWLAQRFGPQFVLSTVTSNEKADSNAYASQPEEETAAMSAEEQAHARLLSAASSGGGISGSIVAETEGRHRSSGGNALRAAVLGANDGLVSNLSLVMGVAGAELAGQGILITGLAGLLAGAGSMALGEWLSVQSSRELYERQIKIEREELAANPEEEAEELSLIYQAKGIPEARARDLANSLLANKATALDTLVREELGIDPQELGGSAWEAAYTSFVLFAIGAIIPVIPFIFTSGLQAVYISVVISALGLFGIGSAITLMTGRSVLFSGSRQVLFGLVAAGLTYGIGRLIGVSIGG